MRSVLFCLLLCQCLSSPVLAGAWLREEGRSFISSSFTINADRDFANETYFEFGLRKDLTLGFDFGLYTLHTGLQSGYGTIFMRRPLGDPDGKNRFSYELGVGAGWLSNIYSPHVKTGLSWGRGLTMGKKSGWINVDTSVTWDLRHDLHLAKIDTTVGINFSPKIAGMMQVHLSHVNKETYTTLAPSVIYAPKSDKFRIQIGALAPLENLDGTAIKVGIWRTF